MFISTDTLKMVLFQHHHLQETLAKSQCQQICWSIANVTNGYAACESQQGTFLQFLAVQLETSMQRGLQQKAMQVPAACPVLQNWLHFWLNKSVIGSIVSCKHMCCCTCKFMLQLTNAIALGADTSRALSAKLLHNLTAYDSCDDKHMPLRN